MPGTALMEHFGNRQGLEAPPVEGNRQNGASRTTLTVGDRTAERGTMAVMTVFSHGPFF